MVIGYMSSSGIPQGIGVGPVDGLSLTKFLSFAM
jgi:hypothetical protein